MAEISKLKKRRGTVKGSITRLRTRIEELELVADQPDTIDHAQRSLAAKLETLDAEYKVHHLSIIDLVDDESLLQHEQETLDEHDDVVSDLSVRIRRLISACSAPAVVPDIRRTPARRLNHLEKNLSSIYSNVNGLSDKREDVFRLKQYEEQLQDYKRELADVHTHLLSIDIPEDDALITQHSVLQDTLFNCLLKIKELLDLSTSKGVKLPKLDVPTFDGNILH